MSGPAAPADGQAARADAAKRPKGRRPRRRNKSASNGEAAAFAADHPSVRPSDASRKLRESGSEPVPAIGDAISKKGLKAGRRRRRKAKGQSSEHNSAQSNARPAAQGDAAARKAAHGTQNVSRATGAQEDMALFQRPAGFPAGKAREARLPALGDSIGSAQTGRRGRPPSGQLDPVRRFSEPDGPLYAALDLGTNNCRLLIARPQERGFRVVDAYSRIVRLGEGVGARRRLSPEAMDRAVEALANCHRKLEERGVERSRLIATEACRAAENGAEFIDRVRRETGLALEIVNRETEARLAVAGCVSLVDQQAEGVILFDIGGGSSEIVWLDLRNRCGARGYALTRFIRSWASLPVGVVNLAERHGGVDVTPQVFEAMVDDVSDHLASFHLADDLSAAISGGGVHMLGTSGTVTTLAGVHFGLKRYDRRRVDGAWLDDVQVTTMIDRLRDMPYEERVENPCIGADRADLVLAGCAILEAIRRRWSCPRLRVADRGLREGILTELMAADGVWARPSQARRGWKGRYRGKS
ncbi:Ppx/GppA phosphatase family protein [Roseibium aquae]